MFKHTLQYYDKMIRKYTPDPFIFAVFLSFIAFLLAAFITPVSLMALVKIWGDGFWGLSTFTLQMVMILLGIGLDRSTISSLEQIE